MSLANVSNISVISLPIAATELANAQHYALPPTTNGNLNPWNKPYDMIKARASMQLNRSPNGISAISDDAVPALGNYHHEERSSHLPESIKTIVILGQQFFQTLFLLIRSTNNGSDTSRFKTQSWRLVSLDMFSLIFLLKAIKLGHVLNSTYQSEKHTANQPMQYHCADNFH